MTGSRLRAAFATLIHLFGNLAPMMTGLITAPFTACALGAEERGVVVIIVAIAAVLTSCGTLGIGWLARDDIVARPAALRPWRLLAARVSRWFVVISGVVGGVLALALGLRPLEAGLTIALCGVSGASAARAVDANLLIALGAPERMGRANLQYAMVVTLGVVTGFVLGGLSVVTVLAINTLGLAVQWLSLRAALTPFLSRPMSDQASGSTAALGAVADRRAVRRMWAAQVGDAFFYRGDVLIMAVTASHRAVGLYSVVGLLVQVAYGLTATAVQVGYSKFPRWTASQRLVANSLASGGVLLVVAAVGGPFAYFLVPEIFGTEFRESRSMIPLALVMAAGVCLYSATMQSSASRRPSAVLSLGLSIVPVAIGVASSYLGHSPALGLILCGLVATAGSMAWCRCLVRELRTQQSTKDLRITSTSS